MASIATALGEVLCTNIRQVPCMHGKHVAETLYIPVVYQEQAVAAC